MKPVYIILAISLIVNIILVWLLCSGNGDIALLDRSYEQLSVQLDSTTCANELLLKENQHLKDENRWKAQAINAARDDYNALQAGIIELQKEYKNTGYAFDTISPFDNFIFFNNLFSGKNFVY